MNAKSRKRNKVIKYCAIGVAILLTLLLLMFNSGVAFLERISGYVVTPVISAADSTVDSVGNFFASFGQRMKLKEELQKANERIAELENVESVAKEVKAENERLLTLWNEKETYPQFSYSYAKVIARSVDDYSATFTLNKGRVDGIKENMVVIAPGGLAGKVVEVAYQSCILLAVTDSRCGVPALSEASRDMGIVKGISSAGTTAGYCSMTQLPTNAIIKPGDAVITSGLGEVFPKGIKIGTVTEVSTGNGSKITSSAKITPSVDFDHLESVLIIIDTGEN